MTPSYEDLKARLEEAEGLIAALRRERAQMSARDQEGWLQEALEQSQHLLRHSHARYQSLFEDSPVPLWVEDFSAVKNRLDELRDTVIEDFRDYLLRHPEVIRDCISRIRIIDLNQAVLDLHKADSKAQLLAGLEDVLTEESYPAFREELAALAEGRLKGAVECTGRTLDGELRWVIVHWAVAPGHEADWSVVFVSALDITEREEAVKQTRFQAQLLDSVRESIVATDVDGRIVYWSKGAEKLYRRARAEALDRPLVMMLGRSVQDEQLDRMRYAYKHGAWSGIFLQYRADGSPFWSDTVITRMADSEGRPSGLISIDRDATQRMLADQRDRERREQLAQTFRLASIGEVAAGLTHELSQPLSAITSAARGGLNLIETGSAGDGRIADYLDLISKQARLAGDIVKHIRGSIHSQGSGRSRVDVNAVVRGAGEMATHEAQRREVTINFELSQDLPPMELDVIKIEQVILNLVLNAMDAMADLQPAQRVLTVRTGLASEGGIEIAVRDNGCGLLEAGERVWEPFYTTKAGGTGLGLPISRRIVEAHGGRLAFTANPEGGMTFTVILPEAQENPRQ